eukprot:TRINITY_DN715_c0_g1_i3.p1 TRINITY_DN715_c0_g1~~TRINITY_DN715_c0_g1_i3.p1  ORF type:complete len:245 (+),score=41.49 TRINITY_DN715_c0_g1_i3:294-1028(+)
MQGDPHEGKNIRRAAMSRENTFVASAGGDNNCGIWSFPDGQLLKVLHGHSKRVYDVAFNSQTTLFASCSDDYTLRIYNIERAGYLTDFSLRHKLTFDNRKSQEPFCVLFHPRTPELAAVAGFHAFIALVDAGTGTQVYHFQFEASLGNIWALAFSANGAQMLSAGLDSCVHVWDVATGAELAKFGAAGCLYSVSFAGENDELIVAAGDDGKMRIWSQDGELLETIVLGSDSGFAQVVGHQTIFF